MKKIISRAKFSDYRLVYRLSVTKTIDEAVQDLSGNSVKSMYCIDKSGKKTHYRIKEVSNV